MLTGDHHLDSVKFDVKGFRVRFLENFSIHQRIIRTIRWAKMETEEEFIFLQNNSHADNFDMTYA